MTNKNLAKLWVSQTRPSGKGNNMYFRNNMIFSYGDHFMIAKIDGDKVEFNTKKYSSSTSRHQSYVKNAIIDAGLDIDYIN